MAKAKAAAAPVKTNIVTPVRGKSFAISANVLSIVKLIEDLEPTAIALVKSLIDRMKGKTPDEIAAMVHAINAATESEIDAEEAKLPK